MTKRDSLEFGASNAVSAEGRFQKSCARELLSYA